MNDGFAPALASALLHSSWQNALLGVAAALVLRAMARSRAASRHAVGMAFLVAMALAPVVHLVAAPRIEALGDLFSRDVSPSAPWVVLLWLLGAGGMLARHVAGLRTIAVMERGVSPSLPPVWQRRVDELRRAFGIARAVAVRLSNDVVTPCAARLLRPVIWLPLSLLARAPAEQVEALLAHELAHVARKDWLWNGVQCVIEALLFFHPAVWWLGRRIRQEREHACDDLAVAACGDPIALAEALATLERERHVAPHLAAGGGALLGRITRLLTDPPARRRRGTLVVLGSALFAGLLFFAPLGMTGAHPPDLQVESSTSGELGPGDYLEIRARGERYRVYRATMDAQGRLTEEYREDGKPRPIDADVRRWILGSMR